MGIARDASEYSGGLNMDRKRKVASTILKTVATKRRRNNFRPIDKNGEMALGQDCACMNDRTAIDHGWNMVAMAQFPVVQVWHRDALVGILERRNSEELPAPETQHAAIRQIQPPSGRILEWKVRRPQRCE
jgi:hypothetical protein